MKTFLKTIANKFGYDILHLPTNPSDRRRLDLIERYNIGQIFDIGANVGQFAMNMRKLKYKGSIVSFEPIPDAFSELTVKSKNDPSWTTVNMALGNKNGTQQLHISENSYSSSLRNILPKHLESAPESRYVDSIDVAVKRMDSIWDKYAEEDTEILVKIDTQGYEKHVFEGCTGVLDKIAGFQMELSLVHLYEGETLLQDMVSLLAENGYLLMHVEEGHRNYDTGELLQFEVMFFRTAK